MHAVKMLISVLVFSASLISQTTFSNSSGRASGAPDLAPGAYLKGLDPAWIDTAADPCVDFYQYSCGGWLRLNPVPGDHATYSRTTEVVEKTRIILRNILEQAGQPREGRSAAEEKIGTYYASCMDEAAIERKGISALKPELDRIAGLRSKTDLAEELAHLHLIGVNAFFNYGSDQDYADASSIIAEVDQAGLGLPERDYYFRTDDSSKKIRTAYAHHLANVFKLLGESPTQANLHSAEVMAIETELARVSLDAVSRREPAALHHKLTIQQLSQTNPSLSWSRYLQATGTPKIGSLNVAEPKFIEGMEKLLRHAKLPVIKAYLRWQLVSAMSSMLPQAFVQENFDFYNRKLLGEKEIQPRWKRCIASVDDNLGQAVGRIYAEKFFGPAEKARTLRMAKDVELAMEQDLQQLPWMSDATRAKALEKLENVANKIGYPDQWRDYSSYRVQAGDALGNFMSGAEFESRRVISKIGQPVDRSEWITTPMTVNAYYNERFNDINFPAGILQPPFYDPLTDDATNYGDSGATLGHELTHAFDDTGRKFDAYGNLRNWWTTSDDEEFENRSACIVDEYNRFIAVDDLHVNGKLTLGENIADVGGLKLALLAYALHEAESGSSKEIPQENGLAPLQRFFLGFGQSWCENNTSEYLRMVTQTDTHSPARHRVNGAVQNQPEFQKAFSCRTGAPMAPAKRCAVW
jgi:endothelin-converting enzyme/putative endopeptidase